MVHFRVMPDSEVPLEKSLGAMFDMQREGKIQHVGVSNVSRAELETALKMGEIASVDSMYGYAQRTTLHDDYGETRGSEEILDLCEQQGIPLIPFFSLLYGLPKAGDKLAELSRKYGVSAAQLNIAWLLHKSPTSG